MRLGSETPPGVLVCLLYYKLDRLSKSCGCFCYFLLLLLKWHCQLSYSVHVGVFSHIADPSRVGFLMDRLEHSFTGTCSLCMDNGHL